MSSCSRYENIVPLGNILHTSGCSRPTGRLNSASSGTRQNCFINSFKFSYSASLIGGAFSWSKSSRRGEEPAYKTDAAAGDACFRPGDFLGNFLEAVALLGDLLDVGCGGGGGVIFSVAAPSADCSFSIASNSWRSASIREAAKALAIASGLPRGAMACGATFTIGGGSGCDSFGCFSSGCSVEPLSSSCPFCWREKA